MRYRSCVRVDVLGARRPPEPVSNLRAAHVVERRVEVRCRAGQKAPAERSANGPSRLATRVVGEVVASVGTQATTRPSFQLLTVPKSRAAVDARLRHPTAGSIKRRLRSPSATSSQSDRRVSPFWKDAPQWN